MQFIEAPASKQKINQTHHEPQYEWHANSCEVRVNISLVSLLNALHAALFAHNKYGLRSRKLKRRSW